MRPSPLLLLLALPLPALAAPPEVSTDDLAGLKKHGVLRFLVPGGPDHLPRATDPRALEADLAREIARRLGLTPVFVPVEEHGRLLDELAEGRGDVVAASLAITPERQAKVAFTRPIRFVKQLVVVKAGDASLKAAADLAGKKVTVRPSSSYAAALAALAPKVPGIVIDPAPESEDTFSLLQRVARGELAVTVADSDIFAAAKAFEPGIAEAFTLTEKDPIAWAIRKTNPELKNALDAALIAAALSSHQAVSYEADLEEIKKRKVLRVVTRNSASCFFLYKGQELGFELELAKEFAKSLGVRLEMIVAPSWDDLFGYLAAGKADLVAAGLTVTPERAKVVDFTEPYMKVSELVIVPAKDKETQELSQLKGKTISVRKSSSYHEHLLARQKELGFEIALLPETLTTDEILRQVGEGKIAATVADSNLVDIELTYLDSIRSVGPLGEPNDLAWAVRKNQPALRAEASKFLKKIYRGVFYNMTVTKYFKNSKVMKNAGAPDRSDKAGVLSPYDALVKKHAKAFELDWRLLTAQMFQESRFDPAAKSWVGALGLMQVMPGTAKDLKVDDVVDPDKGIYAGAKLLARYSKMFDSPDIKLKDRLRFALAAYNCGPGHVFDARRIATDQGLDPNKWFGSVEKTMLLLSDPKVAKTARYGYCRCEEPVKYVSEIQSRYDVYSKLAGLE